MPRIETPLIDATSLDPLLERIGDARIVMLGEASHGTHEYYTWRTRISQRLIEERGFGFIAVEGDWPDCMALTRALVPHEGEKGSIVDALGAFRRWPTWMWANWEIAALGEWLRGRDVGFYGLDVYSLYESMDAILGHLRQRHPDAVADAQRAFGCFDPYERDPVAYARATAMLPTDCEDEVIDVLQNLLASRKPGEGDDHFDAEMNAWAAVDAEAYYRTMVRGSSESWNVRDTHMIDTLERLLEAKGGRAIVWAHNTHVGDARFTDMARRGMTNLGQLARERCGEEAVCLVGFGSYEGSVVAGSEWGAPLARMRVPPAGEGSWEARLHEESSQDRLITGFSEEDGEVMGHRAIGVVYDPAYEAYGNFVPTVVPRRYDAFLYLDRTTALHPLHPDWAGDAGRPDTYPFGV